MSDWTVVEDDIPDAEQMNSNSDWALVSEEENEQNPFMAFIDAINKRGDKYLAPIGAGALNAIPDIGANIGNLALKPLNAVFGTEMQIPRPHLERFLKEGYSPLAFAGGEIAAGLGPAAKMFSLLGKVPGLGASSGFTGNAIKGATLGGAIAPEGERKLGAALGAAGSLIPSAAQVTNKAVGENIVGNFKNLKNAFNKQYEDLFQEATKKGIKNIPHTISDDTIKLLSNASNSQKTERLLESFMREPSLKNSHDVQSSLGKIVNKLSKKAEISSLDNLEKKALKAAQKAQEDIRMSIYREMTKKGGLDLPFKYSDLNTRYAKQLGPYLDNPGIRKAALKPTTKGAISPSRLPEYLMGKQSDPFRAAVGHQYPNLETNRLLMSPLAKDLFMKALQGAGLGAGGYTGYEFLKRNF